MAPVDAPIGIRLVGPEIETLREVSAQVERIMSQHPGTQNVDNPQRTGRSDLRLNVNFEKAGLLGVNSAELDQAVRLAIAGAPAGEIRQSDGDAYTISVRGPAGCAAA